MTITNLEPAAPEIGRPALPAGRMVDVAGRGKLFVRELDGAGMHPPLLLLHGAAVTAALNWCTSYEELAKRSRVVSFDHRGHGRSFRSRRRFRFIDAVDDTIALADELGIERFVPVGYSMGGPIAQLLWQRHPDRVAGIVLGATWAKFTSSRRGSFIVRRASTIGRTSRLMPSAWRTSAYMAAASRVSSIGGRPPWIINECRSGHVPMMLEAMGEIGRFDSTSWVSNIDVPVGLIVLTDDDVVPPARQLDLQSLLPQAHTRSLHMRHDGCITRREEFLPVLGDVVDRVLDSIEP